MIKSKTRRHRQRRNKLSRRMKKRGGVKSMSMKSMKSVRPNSNVHDLGGVKKTRNFNFKRIQDYCIRLFRSTFRLNPSGDPMFDNVAYGQLNQLGFNGRWKNIRTREGTIFTDETMDDINFIKKLNSVVGATEPGWIYNYSSREWKQVMQSTPEEIAEYYNSILWLSQQNRAHIFWVPANYETIMQHDSIDS